MYIIHFKFLAQFVGELCEEQTQEMIEMKKTRPKTTSLGLRGVEMKSKSRDPQKANLGHLLNIHTEFQLTSSNLEVSYARNKLKKLENPTKTPRLLGCEGVKWG